MAVVNLAEKYSDKLCQKFTAGSLVDGRLSNDVSFVGAQTVAVSTIGTVAVNNYDRTAGANRYGTPEEVGDSIQELTMSQDKSFTGIIDKGNSADQVIRKAGRFLSVQANEMITPMMDAYKLKVLAENAGTVCTGSTALKASNIVSRMAAARKALLDARVPAGGRTWFVTTDVFNYLVDSEQFKNLTLLGNRAMVNGQVGELFGAPVVEVPSDTMPAGVNFMLVHRDAACSPVKIAEVKVHLDPPGISGNLVEGRYYFDCFVFEAKKYGIYVDKNAA